MGDKPALRTALVTGATAGLGASFARRLAGDGYRLVLVARDRQRLTTLADDLADRHGVTVEVLDADLATDGGVTVVADRLRSVDAPVDLLVNNAGIGLNRSFRRTDEADELRLLRLNVEAVLRLTHAVLPGMVQRRQGRVINVSSVAGFGPLAAGSTYSASKAWVTNFSESIDMSVRHLGVRVMALCPGYVRTEFHERAGIRTSGSPTWLWLRADDVVADGLRDLARGRAVSVPDWRYKTLATVVRHAPHGLLRLAAGRPKGRE
ncbi:MULTISPECIES: SDR family oxidoreductase [unclassified Solwaraspora]|uniref:SDR family NAD(P)-dependent oxidoreductase n=1 Tax=unclassified Solwaraspora TaxID=2627926 RepID=UPI00248CA736|nr:MULTISPECIES: SDR family oxidoreductase [unclassified Solwaraspora]WBB96970.1 SDR family oxidoreductase [Solwaraspora sp. WMMA2059]WBC19126.1 SDR family oxidoreductase [Solwaraspora sp. WMMA2080]WJK33460.1 SDR family oxidoreductase [Solwaraspora sp. WMMA2065]